jgi:uncharacterized protein
MSLQDVNTMRKAYEAFNRSDIQAVLAAFDTQIEWHEPGGGRAPKGTFRGPQGVAKDVFGTIPVNFEEFKAETEYFIDGADHVVVTGRFRGRSKGGQQLDAPFAHVWTMRNGKAAIFHHYVDATPWARAWGG